MAASSAALHSTFTTRWPARLSGTSGPAGSTPSLDQIAAKACCLPPIRRQCRSPQLRDIGVYLACACVGARGAAMRRARFCLRQRTNAYALLPPSQWVGYRDTDPPPPSPTR